MMKVWPASLSSRIKPRISSPDFVSRLPGHLTALENVMLLNSSMTEITFRPGIDELRIEGKMCK